MANNVKTHTFLPEIFQTETNKKFLNATLDQLISEPNFKKINGFIGRKFAPTYKTTDNYLNESDPLRQNYQLEPSAVVRDPETDKIVFYGSYIDVINKLKYYGADVSHHSRLFTDEYYTYDGKFDFDKFVNFNQYYWLPDGPDAVTVTASGVPLNFTWDVDIDTGSGAFIFTSAGNPPLNPTLTFAIGGTYKFNIRNGEFWIQSKPGITGFDPQSPNINTREVLGVTNNGGGPGTTVEFTVPLPTGQSRFTGMPMLYTVDYASNIDYRDLQGNTMANVISQLGGIDSSSVELVGKKIIFINNNTDDFFWTAVLGDNSVVPVADRTKTWLIEVDENTDIINLVPLETVGREEQVYVRSGQVNATRSFYLDYIDRYQRIPLITAPLTTLYYQNSLSSAAGGVISIVDPGALSIDPVTDIIGKTSYVSPNGVTFTNGLKVEFDSTVSADYAGKQYYVEGVGTGIKLVPVTDLRVPELVNLNTPDYLTINRSSLDQNAWSRSNRWFHIDVIRATAGYNKTDIIIDQDFRAKRPIIEFDANIKLYNYGQVAKSPVDLFDSTITDAYTQVVSVSTLDPTQLTVIVDGVEVVLESGTRVIFAEDANPTVRSKIYDFTIVNISDTVTPNYVGSIAEASDADIQAGNVLIAAAGKFRGREFTSQAVWFDGVQWQSAQQKTAINQEPLFDVFDESGNSYGDTSAYVNSSFAGTKLFSYKRGRGTNDPSLGFPLSYRTFNNVGDIQFDNNFDQDSFGYLVSPITKSQPINGGYLRITTGLNTFTYSNIWIKAVEKSKQYQVISHVADGVNNLFEIDILPEPSVTIPNVKVLINSKFVSINNFGLSQIGARYAILINPTLLKQGDSVDILIYSKSVSKLGHFEVSANLDNNCLNQNFESLTLGQLRNHLVELSHNSLNIIGEVPGANNLRDISIKAQGGNILKHAAPSLYSNLFTVDKQMNLVEGIRLAQREYTRIKNKVLELSTQIQIDPNDISATLDTIMAQINGVKNISFPWYYSDMLPWGQNKTELPPYTVLDPRIRSYELSGIFDDTALSNRAVLVYLTRTQNNVTTKTILAKDRDYSFSKVNPTIVISDSFELFFDDVITIVEYHNTDGNYVPETPTKLGLYPKFVPEILLDNTYVTPRQVIQGHDGSLTPVFGDYRDQLLLEFERRIYNNIKQEFSYSEQYTSIPGRFRTTDYSLKEFNNLLSGGFLTWAGNNRLDFTTNEYFQSNNPWTWNYKNFRDKLTGDFLQGTWRAIYKYWYDTDRPHTHPWEMLGFSDKPVWWEDRYGPAPYTGGNLLLWSELSQGYVAEGPRRGIHPEFVRPQLLQVIPVDDAGNLLSPDKVLVLDFDSSKANASYAVGDMGPVEHAWRRSSDYPFALQLALSLAEPAHYCGTLINVHRINVNPVLGQYLVRATNQHVTPTSIEVNGWTDSVGNIQRTSGYINWICDYLKQIGIAEPQNKLKWNFLNLNIQLSYKAAGFTDKRYLKLLAEQGSPASTNDSIIIPDENYRIELYKSVPTQRIAYSAVIVERSNNGFTVSGYDLSNPYFTIVPSLTNNNAYSITAGRLTGVVYKDYQRLRVKIPYGFEFSNAQQVVDFLVSYQRHLLSQGFVFNEYDYDLGAKQDWILSAREFLTWSQQGWKPGNVIILSPVNQKIQVQSPNAVVDEIVNTPYGSKIMDPNFAVIKNSNFTVTRRDNQFTVTTLKNQTIAFAALDLVQYEHVIIFDNRTVFNDVIYTPDTGNRQFRIKFIGYKTAEWTGALNPPGFIYNDRQVNDWNPGTDYKKGELVIHKSLYYVALENVIASDVFDVKSWKQVPQDSIKIGLLPNFATNAGQFEKFYDVDNQLEDENLAFYSNGLVGFRERQYLTDLALDVETQVKFYQGYIRQKGTKNAILSLAQAQIANISNEVDVYEEWALRVGEYGATDSNQYVEILLSENKITDNPAPIEFISDSDQATAGVDSFRPNDLYQFSRGHTQAPFEPYVSMAGSLTLPTAGYVNINDIDATIFDIRDYSNLGAVLNNIAPGYTIWTAKDFNNSWNVYRVSKTQTAIVSLEYSIDSIVNATTTASHNLQVGDIVAIKNFDDRFDGFYQVLDITGVNSFTIQLRNTAELFRSVGAVSGSGILYKLTSARVSLPRDINAIEPDSGWVENDKVWVDTLDADGNWGVYNKVSPWTTQGKILLNSSAYRGNDFFGSTVKLSKDAKIMYSGAPGSGRAAIFLRTNDDRWLENSNFTNTSTDVAEFGSVVDASDKTFIISAPGSRDNRGYVFIYNVDVASGINLGQILTQPGPTVGDAGDRFGESLAVSEDGNWLYVGAPGANKVYAYGWRTTTPEVETLTGNGIQTVFTLSRSVNDARDILVSLASPFVPEVDYTVSGTTITFIDPPAAGSILVSYRNYYELVDTWTQDGNFGVSVTTNAQGNQILVGANTATYNSVANAGRAYVYDRSIEGFFADGIVNTFSTARSIKDINRVLLNGIVQQPGVDYNISLDVVQFIAIPPAGSTIEIETNEFSILQTLVTDSTATGQRYGTSVDICPTSCSLYVGAPNYSLPSYNSGAVYRYVNGGRRFGTITGLIQNPVVTTGDSIRINGIEVFFNDTTLEHVVSQINSKFIPGVTAFNQDGYLHLESKKVSAFTKLHVLPGFGTALVDLGLEVFTRVQVLLHPSGTENEYFGSVVRIADNNTTLAVGSVGAVTRVSTGFDGGDTLFDVGGTGFMREPVANSGAVYIFDLLDNPFETIDDPAEFAFVQQLTAPRIDSNFNFGYSIDVRNNYIVTGAINDTEVTVQGGSIYAFNNATGKSGWDLIRFNETRVAPDSIDKAYLYSTRNKSILTRLDYVDPVKGKLLGVAQQDIDFFSEKDPAVYNTGVPGVTNANFDIDFYWTNQQLGRTWLDLSQLRYLDYEQGDLLYRSRYWGEFFPGSKIKVYEWVESSVLPSQYVESGSNGVPKYPDDSSYVSYTLVDPATGEFRTLYYYWVCDKTTVDVNQTNRSISVFALQQIIESPKDQGIPYVAAIAPNAMNLYNIRKFLSDNDTALHLDYSPATNTDIIHSEYELVRENAAAAIPARLVNKLQDSLSGLDSAGLVVPDPNLTVATKYGIEIRPRQSMFVDRLTALENFIRNVNSVMIQYPIAEQSDLTKILSGQPQPIANTGAWDEKLATRSDLDYIVTTNLPNGYKILIDSDSDQDGLWTIYQWYASSSTWRLVQIQSYLTTQYWFRADWYASDFDNTIKPTHTVDRYYQIETLTLAPGDTIQLNDIGDGRFAFYRVSNDLSLEQVGIQNGTIQFNDSVYDLVAGGMGFDADNFDNVRFDQTPNREVRDIFDAVYSDILVGRLSIEFNKLFFGLVNYVFSEQSSTDWAFKTSFIGVVHRIRELIQYPSYVKDNQTFYQDYINEVKPYRTQIREYLPTFSGLDDVYSGVTDFSLPASYDPISNTFRSPTGTQAGDAELLETDPRYADWYENYKYSVVDIDIVDGGAGFTLTPNITISGGGGQGATAIVSINTTFGNIANVTIVDAGRGYTTTPNITVNGNGTGAILVPKLKNMFYQTDQSKSYNTSRNITTEIKFDRIGYTTNVVEWQPNTAYTANISVGAGSGNIWLASGALVSYNGQVYKPELTANVTTESSFDANFYEAVAAGNVLLTAGDRVMGLYQPKTGMPGKSLSQVFEGFDYPGVRVTGTTFDAFTSNINLGTGIAFFSANTSIVSTWANVNFIDLGYKLNQQITVIGSTNNDKQFGIVAVSANTILVDTNTVTNEAAGANVTFRYLDNTVVDSVIQSTYLDTALGTRPEDINISGGAYVDRYSSHAPEELMPGRIYDAVDMKVFTLINGNTSILGFRIFTDMNGNVDYTRIADANTTVLSSNLSLTDSNIYVADASVLPEPNPAVGIPGVVFINGEQITYYTRDTLNNVLGQIRRGVNGTGAALVHAANARVVDSSIQQRIDGNAGIYTWLNMTGNVADGTGFEGATTSQVEFLKQSPSYSP